MTSQSGGSDCGANWRILVFGSTWQLTFPNYLANNYDSDHSISNIKTKILSTSTLFHEGRNGDCGCLGEVKFQLSLNRIRHWPSSQQQLCHKLGWHVRKKLPLVLVALCWKMTVLELTLARVAVSQQLSLLHVQFWGACYGVLSLCLVNPRLDAENDLC